MLTGCILITVIILTTGCSSTGTLSLSIWHVYGSQTTSPVNELIQEFNKTVGAENNIKVSVTSVSSTFAIEQAIMASVNGEPGAVDLPDMFTAFGRIAQDLDGVELIDWQDYFTKDELDEFIPEYLADGTYNGRVVAIPVAKSTDILFVNKTLIEKYLGYTPNEENFGTFEQIFTASDEYYEKSGQTMFQSNDMYLYFLNAVSSLNGEFIKDNRPDVFSDEFEKAFKPFAKSAIYGSIHVGHSYASDRWKTGEIAAHIGSTGDILYLRDYVTYPNNVREYIDIGYLPYPHFEGYPRTVTMRGAGLFAQKSEDERKNEACVIFAKWLSFKENNLKLTTSIGCAPTTKIAREALASDINNIANKDYLNLYETVIGMRENVSTLISQPIYDKCATLRGDFEKEIKTALISAQVEYKATVGDNEKDEQLLDKLTQKALDEIRSIYGK